jgi:hypothetical protein
VAPAQGAAAGPQAVVARSSACRKVVVVVLACGARPVAVEGRVVEQ